LTTVFHKFLTQTPKEKRRILSEATPAPWILGHLWKVHVTACCW